MAKKIVYPKLPKKFKEKWLKALRSGEFTQGRGGLHDSDTDAYCCLGVACRIVQPRKSLGGYGFIEPQLRAKVPKMLIGTYDNELIALLTTMNDGCVIDGIKRKSFKQIANFVEKNL